MITTFLNTSSPNGEKTWIDVPDPVTSELADLADQYELYPTLVHDCQEPAHLPKHERHGTTTFIILRHYDEQCDLTQDSIQSMTKKIALFLGDRFLISVHRGAEPFLEPIRDKYAQSDEIYLQVILLEILLAAVETYHRPLEEMELRIHHFETSILKSDKALYNWEEVFRTKCRLTVIKRILWHSMNTVQKFTPFSDVNLPLRQDLRERIENLQFFADSLLDDLNNLLNIQLSLATHRANEATNRTNEVVKVLTLFSAFFLPLNFIVGVYGMNFKYMPELEHPYGYLGVWGVLLAVVVYIYRWFVRKGWIRVGHLS